MVGCWGGAAGANEEQRQGVGKQNECLLGWELVDVQCPRGDAGRGGGGKRGGDAPVGGKGARKKGGGFALGLWLQQCPA